MFYYYKPSCYSKTLTVNFTALTGNKRVSTLNGADDAFHLNASAEDPQVALQVVRLTSVRPSEATGLAAMTSKSDTNLVSSVSSQTNCVLATRGSGEASTDQLTTAQDPSKAAGAACGAVVEKSGAQAAQNEAAAAGSTPAVKNDQLTANTSTKTSSNIPLRHKLRRQ